MNSEKYIGLDVDQATISVAVLDCTGKVVIECILAATTPFEDRLRSILTSAAGGVPGAHTRESRLARTKDLKG